MKPMIRGFAAVQQVADWLEKLVLGQYAQRFAENDITFSIVPLPSRRPVSDLPFNLGAKGTAASGTAKVA
jgi:SAM domain (Sterile alpha motif)